VLDPGFGWIGRQVMAVENDAPGRWRDEPDDGLHQCRLTGAVGANEGGNLVALARKIDVPQDLTLAIADRKAANLEKAHATPAAADCRLAKRSPR
jgi:hypothetical protein